MITIEIGGKMFYIYCYVNKINDYKYVGQTNNIKRRNKEHYSNSFNENSCSYNSLFHKKVREYGWDNFRLLVLEKIFSDDRNLANERESYWIKKLNSFKDFKGYNSDRGGNSLKGSKILTKEEILEIKEKIKKGVTYYDIEYEYSISASLISGINNGYYFKDKNEKYPLYKYYKKDEDYDELIELLIKSDLSYREIAERLKISESTVKKINYGKLRKSLYPSYPIRSITPAKRKSNEIKKFLIETDLSFKEIADIIGVSYETVRCINLGKTYFDRENNYPLRSL